MALSPIDKIIDHTARVESGGRYDAWNADDNGAGVSYGLIQFNQRLGGLSRLLKAMHAKSSGQFNAIFGEYAGGMVDAEWVRQADLNAPHLKGALLQAAQLAVFQQAQRDVARQDYYSQAERLAKQYNLKSERAHAMLFDSFVQWSPGKVKEAMAGAAQGGGAEIEVLRRFAPRMDAGRYTRRAKLLVDPALSDGPVRGPQKVALVALAVVGYLWWRRRK